MALNNVKKYIPQGYNARVSGNAAFFEVPMGEIVQVVLSFAKLEQMQLKIITASDERKEQRCFKIFYIFGIPKEHLFIIPFIRLEGTEEFPSVAPGIHEAWNYERKIAAFFGLKPVGHPDSRRLMLHENWPDNLYPLRKDFPWNSRPAHANGKGYAFEKIEGEGVYEIPVGPIHAGIIEPGHFRFNVAGEEILLLEARLGYTHKGTEKLFETLPLQDKVRLSEKISGDSSFSHSLAFCQAVEILAGIKAPDRSAFLRVVYAELERLSNHFGDIAFIMLDTGFNFGGAHGARLREMTMRIADRLTGSRFLRGVNAIGGVTKDIASQEQEWLLRELKHIEKDFSEVISIAQESESLLNRLKKTGVLSQETALAHGVVGVPRRALGMPIDARIQYPYAAYADLDKEIALAEGGDVYARFLVRVKEVHTSCNLIKQALERIPQGKILTEGGNISLQKEEMIISIVEGWRGEIVHVVSTDSHGQIARVDVRDPSFLNWAALGHAGPGNIVPDFPLINKSFNLSYSGNDL